MPMKRGDFVKAIREQLENSLEAKASDPRFPDYIFETKGEVVDLSGDYALVKFGITPTPNVWLRQDQLETVDKVDGSEPKWQLSGHSKLL
jgi:hypothetical protein